MKTPREILLARHQAVTPKLDDLRRAALDDLRPRPTTPMWRLNWFTQLAEFFRLPKPALAWSALAVAWFVIIALNFATPETSAPGSALATATPPATPETLQALREQKRLFTELVGGTLPHDAETPRFVPRPRSERPPLTTCA